MWVIYLVRFVPFDKLCRRKYFFELIQSTVAVTDTLSSTGTAITEYPIVLLIQFSS
jgi:hypothetical protein